MRLTRAWVSRVRLCDPGSGADPTHVTSTNGAERSTFPHLGLAKKQLEVPMACWPGAACSSARRRCPARGARSGRCWWSCCRLSVDDDLVGSEGRPRQFGAIWENSRCPNRSICWCLAVGGRRFDTVTWRTRQPPHPSQVPFPRGAAVLIEPSPRGAHNVAADFVQARTPAKIPVKVSRVSQAVASASEIPRSSRNRSRMPASSRQTCIWLTPR